MKKINTGFKLWLNIPGSMGAFGDGKFRLLKAIDEFGSLSKACEHLNISYRKAWGDLKKAQMSLDIELVEKHRGGNTGGQTTLTEKGKKLLAAYHQYRIDVEKAVDNSFDRNLKALLSK